MKRKDWIEKISKNIQELSRVPFFGSAPTLDWEALSASLASKLGLSSFSLRPGKQQWKDKDEIKKGMARSSIVCCSLSPLENPICWMMAKSDRDKLLGLIAGSKAKKIFASTPLQDGFYRFILLEVLENLQNLDPLKQMTLQLESESQIPSSTSAFCIDVEISVEDYSCWGRLVLTENFQKNWVQHFSVFPPEYKTTPLTERLELFLGVQIGALDMRAKEWKKIKPGDFLLPEMTYDPKEENLSAATLVLGSTPLFQVRIQQNQIQLIDYAFTIEETMNQKKLAQKISDDPETQQKIKDIPLHVTVELARLEITLDALMHLSSGSTLDLPLHADQKIALTIQGQKVAQAELVRLGTTLGLRILEI